MFLSLIAFGALVRSDVLEKTVQGKVSLSLDCGCGRGLYSTLLESSVSVDINRKLLRKLRLKSMKIIADITCLPFRPNVFDRVMAISVMEHVDDAKFLSEIFYSMKKNATLIVLVPMVKVQHYYDFFGLDCLRDIGHLRMYSKKNLLQTMKPKFKVETLTYLQGPVTYFLEHVVLKLLFLKGRNADSIAPENMNYGKLLTKTYAFIIRLSRKLLLTIENLTPDVFKGEMLVVATKT